MAQGGGAHAFGWSQFPTRVTVDEKGRIGQEQFDRLNEQLNAVCEVHAATSNALSAAEAQNIKLKQESERVEAEKALLWEQNARLCREQQEQDTQNQALKDKCIDAHDRLGRLVEFQVERGDLLRQTRDQQQALKDLENEAASHREASERKDLELAALREECDKLRRQMEAQLRCNEVVTQECSRLKRTLAKNGERRVKSSQDIDDLVREIAAAEKKAAKAEKDAAKKAGAIAELEGEAARLKRERIAALRALQDEQDRAKEREVWLRALRRDNTDLREQLARVGGLQDPPPTPPADSTSSPAAAAAATSKSSRKKDRKRAASGDIPCIETGRAHAPHPQQELLVNLKQQSKLQLKCLTNTVAQLLHTMDKRDTANAAHRIEVGLSRS